MAQQTYRANLSAAIFPLTLASAGRSVIIPGPDNTYDRRVDPEGEQKNAGIPQAIYLENVIPTANGYQSVGYTGRTSIPGANIPYDSIHEILAKEQFYIYNVIVAFKSPNILVNATGPDAGLDGWANVTFSGTAIYPVRGRISYAVVRGTVYVLIKNTTSAEIYEATFDGFGLTLTNVGASVTGLLYNGAIEICGSYNYLIAAMEDGSIQYSSTTNPLDFTTSLVSGAGSISPNNSLNEVTGIELSSNGFYIFTPAGVLHAAYTGNSRYPWKIAPIANTVQVATFSASGINNSAVLTIDTAGSVRYMQGNEAVIIAPELSSYLRQSITFDVYDYTTNVLSVQFNLTTYPPKIYFLHSRYVCVSCESISGVYQTVLIYDYLLRRYGKLKIAHTNLASFNSNTAKISSKTIDILNAVTGVRKVINFEIDVVTNAHQGVLILGKFQYVRSRNICLDELNIEGKFQNCSVILLPSLNGKTFDAPVTPAIVEDESTLKSYTSRLEAKNCAVAVKGQFSIDSLELTFHPGSAR